MYTSDSLQQIVHTNCGLRGFRRVWIHTVVVQLSTLLSFDDALISGQSNYSMVRISRHTDDDCLFKTRLSPFCSLEELTLTPGKE